jgi:aspartate kinase
MLVFKFGGASVKDAEGVRNLSKILELYRDEELAVVVSAMAKTTNALECLTRSYYNQSGDTREIFEGIKDFHYTVLDGLFGNKNHIGYQKVDSLFMELANHLQKPPTMHYDFDYDQIVPFGELVSTTIISEYLISQNINTQWIDIRKCLKTDDNFREGNVLWELTDDLVKQTFHFNNQKLYITQGFLGSTINNLTTTLGREGSDYTGAVLAYILNAEKLVIWKDVPGVLNADPKWFEDTELLPKVSYMDAIELAYYGASIIHPKTIQPLQNKKIPLQVKSFLDHGKPGTLVGDDQYERLIPSFIFKMDQVLIQIQSMDFSFIAEKNLGAIFGIFSRHGLRINLMQNSAVSFMVCVNNDQDRLPLVIKDLKGHFKVSTENGLELVTIRYFDNATISRVLVNKEKLLEQRGKTTIQMVIRNKS